MNLVRPWIFDFFDIIFSTIIEHKSAGKTAITVKIALKLERKIVFQDPSKNYSKTQYFSKKVDSASKI